MKSQRPLFSYFVFWTVGIFACVFCGTAGMNAQIPAYLKDNQPLRCLDETSKDATDPKICDHFQLDGVTRDFAFYSRGGE